MLQLARTGRIADRRHTAESALPGWFRDIRRRNSGRMVGKPQVTRMSLAARWLNPLATDHWPLATASDSPYPPSRNDRRFKPCCTGGTPQSNACHFQPSIPPGSFQGPPRPGQGPSQPLPAGVPAKGRARAVSSRRLCASRLLRTAGILPAFVSGPQTEPARCRRYEMHIRSPTSHQSRVTSHSPFLRPPVTNHQHPPCLRRPASVDSFTAVNRKKICALVLGLSLLGGAAAPYAFARSLFPCEGPSDCAAMRELCDMAGIASHDSCCQPARAGQDFALPAVSKAAAALAPAHSVPAALAVAVVPTLSAGSLIRRAAVAVSPPGSPPALPVLRI